MADEFCEVAWPEADGVAEALIGACMTNRDAADYAILHLTPEDIPDHLRPIYKAIVSLTQKGRKAAPVLVAEEMRRLGLVPKGDAGTPETITPTLLQIARSYMPGSVEDYCAILQRYSLQRRIREAGHKLVDLANDCRLSSDQYRAQAESILTAAVEVREDAGELKRMGEVVRQQLAIHKARKPGTFEGLPTGFQDLDFLLRGMQPGDLLILAARPSMGKTALAQSIANRLAKWGKSVIVVIREMADAQLADRLIAAEGPLNAGKMRVGLVPASQWTVAENHIEQSGLLTARYWIDDTSSTVPQIRAKAMRLKRSQGLDLIIVDYLQLMDAVGNYRGNKVQEVSEISRAFKLLAKELGVPIIVLSQLSRSVEQREDKRPILSDLRDSGSIEQDADVVLFLYRESYYKRDREDGITEVIVAKNRNGPVGTARLLFIKESTRFVSLEQKHD